MSAKLTFLLVIDGVLISFADSNVVTIHMEPPFEYLHIVLFLFFSILKK